MKEGGIHVHLSEKWSEELIVYGKPTKYRLWNKKDKVFCLKGYLERGKYVIEISDSLENVDIEIGEIFDIPNFPFDKQYSIQFRDRKPIGMYMDDERIPESELDKTIKKVFSYNSLEELAEDLFKGI